MHPLENASILAPFARVYDLRGFFNVAVSERGVAAFNRQNPGSNLRGLRGVTFQFDKKNGDLVDVFVKNGSMDDWDSSFLKSLSDDARDVATFRLGLGLAFGRTKKKSARPCNCSKR